MDGQHTVRDRQHRIVREAFLNQVERMDRMVNERSVPIVDLTAWNGNTVREVDDFYCSHYHWPGDYRGFDLTYLETPSTLTGMAFAMLADPAEVRQMAKLPADVHRRTNESAFRLLGLTGEQSMGMAYDYVVGSPEVDSRIEEGLTLHDAADFLRTLCYSGIASWEVCAPKDHDWLQNRLEEVVCKAADLAEDRRERPDLDFDEIMTSGARCVTMMREAKVEVADVDLLGGGVIGCETISRHEGDPEVRFLVQTAAASEPRRFAWLKDPF